MRQIVINLSQDTKKFVTASSFLWDWIFGTCRIRCIHTILTFLFSFRHALIVIFAEPPWVGIRRAPFRDTKVLSRISRMIILMKMMVELISIINVFSIRENCVEKWKFFGKLMVVVTSGKFYSGYGGSPLLCKFSLFSIIMCGHIFLLPYKALSWIPPCAHLICSGSG